MRHTGYSSTSAGLVGIDLDQFARGRTYFRRGEFAIALRSRKANENRRSEVSRIGNWTYNYIIRLTSTEVVTSRP